jgi:hypothetical protein
MGKITDYIVGNLIGVVMDMGRIAEIAESTGRPYKEVWDEEIDKWMEATKKRWAEDEKVESVFNDVERETGQVLSRYYVYSLRKLGVPFYYGKGQGGRVHAHVDNARKGIEDGNAIKKARILWST